MFKFILFLIKLFFSLFNKDMFEIFEMMAVVKKENDILKRHVNRIQYTRSDRIFFVLVTKLFKQSKDFITMVKPETILKWYRNLIKNFWTFFHQPSRAGRPCTPQWIRNLILDMKNNNLLRGNKRIQGELEKIGVENVIKSPSVPFILIRPLYFNCDLSKLIYQL